MSRFDWQLKYLSLHTARKPERGSGKELHCLGVFRQLDEDHAALERLVDSLLLSAFRKKRGITAASACKVYNFQPTDAGGADRELLRHALDAEVEQEFSEAVDQLAHVYAEMPTTSPALLIGLLAHVTTPQDSVLPFFCLFGVNIEQASLFGEDQPGPFLRTTLALEPKPSKALLYPLLDGGRHDADRLLIVRGKPAECWDDLLAVEAPPTPEEVVTEAMRRALSKKVDRATIDRYFSGPPPKKRPLFGEGRYVSPSHLLDAHEAKHVGDVVAQAAYEATQKVLCFRVSCGKAGKVEIPLSQLGRDFFLARNGDEQFLIVRAQQFTAGGPLTAVEFAEIESLATVLGRLDLTAQGTIPGVERGGSESVEDLARDVRLMPVENLERIVDLLTLERNNRRIAIASGKQAEFQAPARMPTDVTREMLRDPQFLDSVAKLAPDGKDISEVKLSFHGPGLPPQEITLTPETRKKAREMAKKARQDQADGVRS